jgi:hypothetical protein
MTTLLEQAVAKAKSLPAAEQDALARLMLEEIESDEKWDRLLAASTERLNQKADKAWAEHEAGRSLPLDPETL